MGVWPLNIKVLPQGRDLAKGRGLTKRKKVLFIDKGFAMKR
jgi:hypothetical protein